MPVLNDDARTSVKDYIINTYKYLLDNMYKMQPEDVYDKYIDLAEYVTILNIKELKECFLWERKLELVLMTQRSLNSNYNRFFIEVNKKHNQNVSESDQSLYNEYVRSFEFDIKSKELLDIIKKDPNNESARADLAILYKELREYYLQFPFSKIGTKVKDALHKTLLTIMGTTLKFDIEPSIDIESPEYKTFQSAKTALKYKYSNSDVKSNAKQYIKDVNDKTREVYPDERPVIFACNHTNVHDVPTICKVIQERVCIVAGDEVTNDINGFMFRLNGVDFVSRHIPESRFHAKEMAVRRVINGSSYKVLPEGTWNRTESKPMIYFNWGIIEIAQKSQAPIIPVVIEYTNDVCYYKIGEPMYVSIYDDKLEAINKLRDTMATMRWEIWENLPHEKRENVSKEKFYDEVVGASLREYPKLDTVYEDSVRFMPYVEQEEAFEHLDTLKLTRNNAFLLNKDNHQ